MAAAAAGLTSGLVHSVKRSRSPTTPMLDEAQTKKAGTHMFELAEGLVRPPSGGDDDSDDFAPPMFVPGTGVLDVDAVEHHMRGLLKVESECIERESGCLRGEKDKGGEIYELSPASLF